MHPLVPVLKQGHVLCEDCWEAHPEGLGLKPVTAKTLNWWRANQCKKRKRDEDETPQQDNAEATGSGTGGGTGGATARQEQAAVAA